MTSLAGSVEFSLMNVGMTGRTTFFRDFEIPQRMAGSAFQVGMLPVESETGRAMIELD